jgi:hypothetical protein
VAAVHTHNLTPSTDMEVPRNGLKANSTDGDLASIHLLLEQIKMKERRSLQ